MTSVSGSKTLTAFEIIKERVERHGLTARIISEYIAVFDKDGEIVALYGQQAKRVERKK